ncbi:MAG: hypothetical protein OXP09_18250 [Gammaproteobacteria bacterium]|nr:hypothetical protein [Gammaproteobacteria bacterium]MDE0367503.1 hypothetical protein [Gammaproteobacteria bacterium]
MCGNIILLSKYRFAVMTKSLFSFLLCLAVTCFSANARTAEIDTAQLFTSVAELRAEIEQIRVVMGEPLPPSREVRIHDAVPRHVFYQAQTLFRKSNQFAQQMAGVSRQPPRLAPEGDIGSADVLGVLDDTRVQIGLVKTALGIDAPVAEAKLDRRARPSDVLYDIIEAGRVINFISGRTVDWTTVYDRVLLAITYVGGALPEADRFPPLSPFEPGKFPQDIIGRLQQCMELSREPAAEHGVAVLRVESIRRTEVGPTVIEVLDMATIVLSDLAELTYEMGAEDVPTPDYPRPNRVFPSHVFQLVGVLVAQLEMLAGN